MIDPSRGQAHIRVLTHFDYGGWCRFAMYEAAPTLDIRVTTDNRTQGVPDEHCLDSFQLHNVKGSWLQTLDAWRPDAVVVALSFPLAQFLAFDKVRWELVHEDHALFRRR